VPKPAAVREVDGLVVSEYLLSGPLTLERHAHGAASLSLLLHGGYRVETPTGAQEIRAPMVAFFPGALERRVIFGAGPVLFLWVELPAALTARLGGVRPNACGFVPASSGRPEWLAHRLLADVRATDAASGLRLEGRLLEILGSLPGPGEGTAGSQPAWLPAVLRALDARADRVPLAELARVCGLHPAHLCRAFKAHMGCSIGEYGRQSRVSRARTLLLASELGLAAIAAECGFADQAHFSREFKRQTGRPPGAFRRAGS